MKAIKIHYRLLYMLLFGRTLENPKRNKRDLVIELVAYVANCKRFCRREISWWKCMGLSTLGMVTMLDKK